MAVCTALDAILVEVFMAVGATGVNCILERGFVFAFARRMTIGTSLRFGLDIFVVMACLAILVRVIFRVVIVGKLVSDRWGVVANDTLAFVERILMAFTESIIEFADMAGPAGKGRFTVA